MHMFVYFISLNNDPLSPPLGHIVKEVPLSNKQPALLPNLLKQ